MAVPKCEKCGNYRCGIFGTAIPHKWCLITQGTAGVHGGRIIPVGIKTSPKGCPLRKTDKAKTCEDCDTSNECGGVEGECPFKQEGDEA